MTTQRRSRTARSIASPLPASTAPISATAISPPIRATALLNPEAMARLLFLDEPRAPMLVSGATAMVIPSAIDQDARKDVGPIAAVPDAMRAREDQSSGQR